MRIGTKSLLFGVHNVVIHPVIVAVAWAKLYGFPRDPRLWLAFVVHDLGYFGKPNMDGPEGERHVELGARLMGRLFGKRWHDECLYHSRHRAEQDGVKPSRLCYADKLAIALYPMWLYLVLGNASGEIREYMERCKDKYNDNMGIQTCQLCWLNKLQHWGRTWAFKNAPALRVWRCRFCSFIHADKIVIDQHMNDCAHNPANRTCSTCKHSIGWGGSMEYCMSNGYEKAKDSIGCRWWSEDKESQQ